LSSIWSIALDKNEQVYYLGADLRARDATLRVINAEYRFRDLHAAEGFSCDLKSLKSLGGPSNDDQPFWKPRKPNTIFVDFYTLSLGACQGQPVTKYEISTFPDPAVQNGKIAAYCSDGSGTLYFSTDGKSETCLAGRKVVH
jgi:hypothetical protein